MTFTKTAQSRVSNKWLHITPLLSFLSMFYSPFSSLQASVHAWGCQIISRSVKTHAWPSYDLWLGPISCKNTPSPSPPDLDSVVNWTYSLTNKTHPLTGAYVCQRQTHMLQQTHVYCRKRWLTRLVPTQKWQGRGSWDSDMDKEILLEQLRETAESNWQRNCSNHNDVTRTVQLSSGFSCTPNISPEPVQPQQSFWGSRSKMTCPKLIEYFSAITKV